MLVEAPWTEEQVVELNKFQTNGHMHPFMCINVENHPPRGGVLVAEHDGWFCPHCSYRQSWAHDFMLNQRLVPNN